MVASLEVAVEGVDNHGFLKWPLMAFLVEAHAQLLYRRRALSGQGRTGMVFGRNKIRGRRFGVLKQGPVGIKTKRRFKPGTVGHAGGAQGVVDDDLLPGSRDDGLDIAIDRAQKGHVLGHRI